MNILSSFKSNFRCGCLSQSYSGYGQTFPVRGHSITTWTRWEGKGSKNVCFCPHSGYKNCPRMGGGQNSVHVVVECPLGMWNMIEETAKLHAIDWGIVSLIGGREEKFWQPCQRVFRGDFAPFFITDERTLGARNRVVYLFSYSILVLYSRALQFYQDRADIMSWN